MQCLWVLFFFRPTRQQQIENAFGISHVFLERSTVRWEWVTSMKHSKTSIAMTLAETFEAVHELRLTILVGKFVRELRVNTWRIARLVTHQFWGYFHAAVLSLRTRNARFRANNKENKQKLIFLLFAQFQIFCSRKQIISSTQSAIKHYRWLSVRFKRWELKMSGRLCQSNQFRKA